MEATLETLLPQKTGSSFMNACFNTTNAFLGIGLLTIPYALASGGWLSMLLFFIVATMTFYNALLIKLCLDNDPSIKSYLQISERAFGKRGGVIVSIIMNLDLYLVGIGLLILEADNLCKLFPKFMINIGSLHISGTHSFIIVTALVILPSMLLTDLSILSYVSATGVFSCFIIFISILCVGIFNHVGFTANGSVLLNTDRGLIGFFTAVNLYIVCFSGHPVVPPIYTSMQNPHQFNKVLLLSFAITTITYLSTAVLGYLMYGNAVDSQITLNLPEGKVSAKIAIYTTLLIPVTRFALMLVPVASCIENAVPENYRNSNFVKYIIRISLLISTVGLACAFPYFENLMSIIGAIFSVTVSLLLPSLFHLKISGSYKKWSYKNVGIAGILVFGAVAGIMGTYSSIADLLDKNK